MSGDVVVKKQIPTVFVQDVLGDVLGVASGKAAFDGTFEDCG